MAFIDTNAPSLQNKPKPAPLKHLQGVKVLDLHFSTDISIKIIVRLISMIRITFFFLKFTLMITELPKKIKKWPFLKLQV